MKARSWSLALVAVLGLGEREGLAQDAAEPPLLIEVVSGTVPTFRPQGGAWDPEPGHRSNPGCALIGVLGDLVQPGAGRVAQPVCSALSTSAAPEADPTAPDVFIEVDFGIQRARILSPTARDTSVPSWQFAFYARRSDIPRGGIDFHLADDDAAGPERIDTVAVSRRELLAAATGDGRIVGRGGAGATLSIRVAPVQPDATRAFDLQVSARTEGVPAPDPAVPVGALVRVEAAGHVVLGDPSQFPATGPDGSADLASRSFNLRSFPTAPFGALVLWLGRRDAQRQQVVVGPCREFTASESGVPVFAINDSSRDSNRGQLQAHVTISPPPPGRDPLAAYDAACQAPAPVAQGPAPEGQQAVRDHILVRAIRIVVPRRDGRGAEWDGNHTPPDVLVTVAQGGRRLARNRTAIESFEPMIGLGALWVDTTAGPVIVEVVDDDDFGHRDRIGTAILDVAAGQTSGPLGDAGQVSLELAAARTPSQVSPVPPFPANNGAPVEARESDLYMSMLQRLFRANFRVPASVQNVSSLRCEVRVAINRDLTVGIALIAASSGDAVFDQSALTAASAVGSVPPPPPEIAEQVLGRTLTIRYRGNQN